MPIAGRCRWKKSWTCVAYYEQCRKKDRLRHEPAMRESVVAVLMSPDFLFRFTEANKAIQPLSDFELANRLSYFLWSSMPDDELLSRAAAGDLHKPAVLVAQARRMLKDARVRGLAVEFGGNWLDIRRFEEHRHRRSRALPELHQRTARRDVRGAGSLL